MRLTVEAFFCIEGKPMLAVQQQVKLISELGPIKRIIGTKYRNRNGVQTRNLTDSEIAAAGSVSVERDCEGYWISKSGGAGWDCLLVVLV